MITTDVQKQNRKCMNATLKLVHVTIVAVEKQYVLHILNVCLQP